MKKLFIFFHLYFTKFSFKTVSIRVKFGSSKEKITTQRMYIYLRLYLENFCIQLTLSFSDTLHLFFAPYRRVCGSKWGSIIEKIQKFHAYKIFLNKV